MKVITDYASLLLKAEETQVAIAPITITSPHITVDEAYQIQLDQIAAKVKKGRKIVGKKIGLTSKAMQNMLNVNQPDYGHLLDDMMIVDGDTLSLQGLIQPKLEFEIAFVLKKDLKGPFVTFQDVIEATDYVVPAIEVIDSRIENWNIKFEDTVADNGSSARAVIGGKPTSISNVDLSLIGMAVYRNGQLLDTAAGAAVMANPIHAVAWLANSIAKYDISLYAGEIVLSGALTAAVPVKSGDTFTVKFDRIGEVSLTIM